MRVVRALAALFLLVAITSDLLADARCDEFAPVDFTSVVREAGTGRDDTDSCATGCVPDCYCCSHTVAGTLIVVAHDGGPASRTPSLAPVGSLTGVQPVVDHPPLHLS
ncbi:MAG: hypothetical protein KJ067_24570 [Vicinamibacteria bacterium]|jgi:hypothetical protein|nr:hypothetical protein [Vicinamibacteria bacterium]